MVARGDPRFGSDERVGDRVGGYEQDCGDKQPAVRVATLRRLSPTSDDAVAPGR